MDGGRAGDSTTVPADRAAPGRAAAAAGGRGGSRGGGRRRRVRGGVGDGRVPPGHSRRGPGVEAARGGGLGSGADSPTRWRAQAHHRSGPDVADGLGAADRADHTGGSGVAAAMDVQERPALGQRTGPTGPSHEPPDGGRAAPAAGLQPAGQSQDDRGHAAPRSQRAVRAHRGPRPGHAAPRSASDLRRYQEEGARGAVQDAGREWRVHGQPRPVRVHDFVHTELGRAIPYGVYDLGANTGWVSIGIDHDTAAFAVARIRHCGRPWGAGPTLTPGGC
jgi:Rhodopirellula transposase DDE domain